MTLPNQQRLNQKTTKLIDPHGDRSRILNRPGTGIMATSNGHSQTAMATNGIRPAHQH